MNIEKLIRFGFASPKRRVMTLCIAGAAAVTSFLGIGAKEPAKKPAAVKSAVTTTSTAVQAGAVADVSYANCDAVRAAGKAPLRTGDPGYSAKLDRDGDGIACS